MPDPRLQLTRQELEYGATALRALAHRVRMQAADPQYQSSRAVFAEAANVYEELAAKLSRIAEALERRKLPR